MKTFKTLIFLAILLISFELTSCTSADEAKDGKEVYDYTNNFITKINSVD